MITKHFVWAEQKVELGQNTYSSFKNADYSMLHAFDLLCRDIGFDKDTPYSIDCDWMLAIRMLQELFDTWKWKKTYVADKHMCKLPNH